jgi:hypothetical protein
MVGHGSSPRVGGTGRGKERGRLGWRNGGGYRRSSVPLVRSSLFGHVLHEEENNTGKGEEKREKRKEERKENKKRKKMRKFLNMEISEKIKDNL